MYHFITTTYIRANVRIQYTSPSSAYWHIAGITATNDIFYWRETALIESFANGIVLISELVVAMSSRLDDVGYGKYLFFCGLVRWIMDELSLFFNCNPVRDLQYHLQLADEWIQAPHRYWPTQVQPDTGTARHRYSPTHRYSIQFNSISFIENIKIFLQLLHDHDWS